jgi:hypothetical protein
VTEDANALAANHSDKLKSILARRGGDWGFSGNVTASQIQAFAEIIVSQVANADEVWQSPFRGSDRLFYILDGKVIVTHLDGTFESTWQAAPAQIAHYRTGAQIK